jgi:regulatory protein
MNDDFLQMLEKARRYCLRSEKCLYDVRQKLYKWEVPMLKHEEILSVLVEERFVDESRYTKCYVHDKCYLSKWGRNKIIYSLKHKQISNDIIQLAVQQIDNKKYQIILEEVAKLKWKSIIIRENDIWKARQKLTQFLYQRGFEMDVIVNLDFSE